MDLVRDQKVCDNLLLCLFIFALQLFLAQTKVFQADADFKSKVEEFDFHLYCNLVNQGLSYLGYFKDYVL